MVLNIQKRKKIGKYTKKKKLYPICIIDGFPDMRSACQCEWRLKHLAKRGIIRNVNDRISHLSNFISDKDKNGLQDVLIIFKSKI